MNKADRVRAYAQEKYFLPARERLESQVTIVAGDVAKALDLSNRMPLVCGALGTLKLRDEFSVQLASRGGPGQGSNATFTFKLI